MEIAGLFGVLLLLYLFIAPWVALVKISHSRRRVEAVEDALGKHTGAIAELRSQVLSLREQLRTLQLRQLQAAASPAVEPVVADPATQTPDDPRASAAPPVSAAVFTSRPPAAMPPVAASPPASTTELPDDLVAALSAVAERAAPVPAAATPVRLGEAPWLESTPAPVAPPPRPQPASAPQPSTAQANNDPLAPIPPPPLRPATATAAATRPPAWRQPSTRETQFEPAAPSAVDTLLGNAFKAARDWLFGGNLVARIGLVILFIGIAFLLRLAASHVSVPIEIRLAGVAAGGIALLVWGWRIRETRRGIGLPVQGMALAILMLVVFGAFKLWNLIPALPTFALLIVLVGFTCILAVLQDALWLAIFGIVGGFAVPILLATGSGSHIGLFSYYAVLNAGILAIALRRSWRMLNVLGFLFTFIIGTAWGVQRYEPQHYPSAQAFLILFVLFYIAIAILYAWRRAPKLLSYVDGTLVFGVPMVAMALQFGLVKHIEYGMSFSALALGLLYASIASALWRSRRETLRLLVESFFALAVVFGTLAIPLAFDGRWTSAAWALEGAGIIWIGLRQKQALAWRFGILVQVGSWIAFLRTLTGLNATDVLQNKLGFGFGLLGVSAVFLALLFHGSIKTDPTLSAEERARQRFSGLATAFIVAAVGWLLAGMWVEAWFRLDGGQRAGMLVLTAIGLVVALQLLGRKVEWKVPELLGGVVSVIAGATFIALMARAMDWHNIAVYPQVTLLQLLSDGALFGGLLLCGGATVSAFAFKRRARVLADEHDDASGMRRAAAWWWAIAVFWWCGFVLNSLAHALAWSTHGATAEVQPWYAIAFWSAYAIGLAISAWAWTALALRARFPGRRAVLLVVWPTISAVAGLLFLLQVGRQLALGHTLDLAHAFPDGEQVAQPWLAFFGGALPGGLILCLLGWLALRQLGAGARPGQLDLSDDERRRATGLWLLGMGFAWYLLVVDPLALLSARLLNTQAGMAPQWWQLPYAQAQLLWVGLSAMLFTALAHLRSLPALRWLSAPAAVLQAIASVLLLDTLYADQQLPGWQTGIALTGLWLAMAWCLRFWTIHGWSIGPKRLHLLHVGRVIAPWMAIFGLVSLSTWPWLAGRTLEDAQLLALQDWVVDGMWPDYLGAWAAIAGLVLLLRQAQVGGFPLRPLQWTYRRVLLPLATVWAVLLACYWNLHQDGGMAPLPYLPVLNPLDLTSAFVALLVTLVWRANRDAVAEQGRAFVVRGGAWLGYAWFNLMLLRTAAHYLGLPYRFDALYGSQFVQAMLSLVWTLSAFLLMRHAVKRLSKPLWMVGAAGLAVVVLKLFLVDLSGVGSVARIVSFMGVGGCMLLIGYLAPLPRAAGGSDPDQTRSAGTLP